MRALLVLTATCLIGLACGGLVPPLLVSVEGPCEGYRTEALWFDADGTAWAGCGSDPGLFRSATPAAGRFQLVEAFEHFLVYDVRRGPDGRLYVAGRDRNGPALLRAMDTTEWPRTRLEDVLDYSGRAPFMRLSHAQHVAFGAGGAIMVDSSTGTQIGVFDGREWNEHELWTDPPEGGRHEGFQMSALLSHDGRFYASGSTSSRPHVVFLPTDSLSRFEPVFPGGDRRIGTLEGLAVLGEDRMVAAGVDERVRRGVIYHCAGECHDAASWREVDLAAAGISGVGKLWSAHFDPTGRTGIVVGERHPQSDGGVALVTRDGGATWTTVPQAMPILTVGRALGDGRFAVAGGDRFFAMGRWLE